MAVLQGTYAATIPQGFPGMVVNGETSNRISRTVEDAAGIAFGKATFKGTGDHGITATPTAGAFEGITISSKGGFNPTLGGAPALSDLYGQYGTAGLMTLGVILVTSAVAVAKKDPVYVTPAGLFTNVSTNNIALTIGGNPFVFDNTITAAGLVRIARR